MTSWQRRARLGVAIVGLAVAAAVYGGLREREPRVPAARVERTDPAAVLETTAGRLQQVRGAEHDFEITAARTLSYQDGTTRQFEVRITVPRGEGRDYVITADQAEAGNNRRELQLSGGVTLIASDGFTLQTDRGSFHQDDGVVRAPGHVTFRRGLLTGSGVGMSYDEQRDLLHVSDRSQVRIADAQGETVTQFTATTATLDRDADLLTLAGDLRARRGTQTIQADRGDAQLSPAHDAMTFIALRGRARVAGGAGSPGTMSARDIDLDYDEAGETLERVAMRGAGVISFDGEGASGRRLAGDTLDLQLAPDGSLTHATGQGHIRLDLPGQPGMPGGVVRARTFTATGEAGRGLTEARFDHEVEYLEGTADEAARSARARSLRTTLTDAGISSAMFSGDVIFQADDYDASAGEAQYQPEAGVLQLRGGEARDQPRVQDDGMAIGAQAIDLTLDTRQIQARGSVRTALTGAGGDGTRLPGLLQADVPAHVTADALDYDGDAGTARYAGGAVLWQGDTALRADVIRIDQARGDLVATGSARSTMALEDGRLDGRADEMAYDDRRRVLTYTVSSDTKGGGGPPAAAEVAQLVGPAGDLQARRIAVVLSAGGGEVERIEGATDVRVDTGQRTVTGARLTYDAATERYEMTGTIGVPVRVTEACGETQGRTLIFFASADRMIVDGHEQVRTQTTRGSCRE